jgi:site-specific DNA recombinase
MVVKMIFNWVDKEGLTQRKIIKRLQELNIQPRKSKRGVWSTSTLTTLLRNKTYIGEAKWGGSYSVVPKNPKVKDTYRKNKKSSRKVKPESEWYTIPVPAIIEKEVFYRVRKRIEANYILSIRNTKNEYLLTGVIYCTCGKRRTGEGPQNGKYLYYRCCDRINNFPFPKTCEEKGIDAKIADHLVWNSISELLCSAKLIEKQIQRFEAARKNKLEHPEEETDIIEKEISKLKVEEERYCKAYGSGVFAIEKLAEYLLPIKEKISSLESQINRIKQIKSENAAMKMKIPNKEQIHEFTEKTRTAIKDLNFEQKKSIIRNVISKIEGTPQKLKICGYIPITTKNDVDFFSGDRNRRPTKCRKINIVQRSDKKECSSRKLPFLYY